MRRVADCKSAIQQIENLRYENGNGGGMNSALQLVAGITAETRSRQYQEPTAHANGCPLHAAGCAVAHLSAVFLRHFHRDGGPLPEPLRLATNGRDVREEIAWPATSAAPSD